MKSAFTLVELLISVSIIVILTGAIIPSFSGYIRDQALKQAIEQVKSDLRTVQNNALNDSLPQDNTLSDPQYWGVLFEQGNSNYYYFVTEDEDCVGSKNDNTKFTLSENISPTSDFCILFSFENGNVYGNKYVSLTNGKDIQCISLNEAGLIYTGVWNGDTSTCD